MNPFIGTLWSNEGDKVSQTFSDEALMVVFLLIHDTKSGIATRGVCQALYPGQQISIRNSLLFQEAIIDAHLSS